MDVDKLNTGMDVNKSKTQTVQEKVRLYSLDLVFALAKESLDAQLEQVDRLDDKADSTQVSATALIGAALVLEAVLITLNISFVIRIVQIALLLPLLVVYIIIVISASRAYGISEYHGMSNPKTLIVEYLKAPKKLTKKRMLTAMGYAYDENEKISDQKAKLIDRAIRWRTIEATILVVVLLIQVILVLFTHGTAM